MIKYRHFRFDGGGGLTLGYENMGNGDLTFATAFCSKKDQFCKRLGRELVEDRITFTLNFVTNTIEKDQVLVCLLALVSSHDYPDKLEKGIKRALARQLLCY